MPRTRLPGALYKYYSAKLGLQVLKSQTLWFTRPAAFNDLFDVNPQVVKATKTSTIRGSRTRIQFPVSIEKVLQASGAVVFCMTADPTSQLMWAHYAEQHCGLLIEFSSHVGILEGRRLNHQSTRPVKYTRQRPSMGGASGPSDDIFFVKGNDWSYEREWRMLDAEESASGQPTKDKKHWPFRLNPAAVARVYVGARCSDELRLQVLRVVANHPYQHVGLGDIMPDDKRFLLKLDKWDDAQKQSWVQRLIRFPQQYAATYSSRNPQS
jgi:hypothetical protein